MEIVIVVLLGMLVAFKTLEFVSKLPGHLNGVRLTLRYLQSGNLFRNHQAVNYSELVDRRSEDIS